MTGAGGLLARSDGGEPLSPAALEATGEEVRERARAGARRGYAPSGELHGRSLALPVVRTPAGGNGDGPAPQAWLVAAKDRGGLTEFDRLVLHQAVTIVALELLRRRVADDTERRLAGDVLSAMVSGELAGAGAGPAAGAVRPARARRRARAHPAALGQGAGRGRADRGAARRAARRPRGGDREVLLRAAPARARGVRRGPVRARRARARAGLAPRRASSCPAARDARSPRSTCAARSTRRAARWTRRRSRARRTATARRSSSPRSATSARSSCCCRCRTTRRCDCSATRSSRRSRTARAPTAAS